MSCDTYFYAKLDKQPKEKIILKTVLKDLQKNLKFNDKYLNSLKNNSLTRSQKSFLKDFDWACNVNEKSHMKYFKDECYTLEKIIEEYTGFLDEKTRIELYEYYTDIISNTKKFNNKIIEFFKDYGFYIETDTYNIFRKFDYPKDILDSFEKSFEYYLLNNCSVFSDSKNKYVFACKNKKLDNKVKKDLEKFFKEYKNGLIIFG
jgi:hypothetical protein